MFKLRMLHFNVSLRKIDFSLFSIARSCRLKVMTSEGVDILMSLCKEGLQNMLLTKSLSKYAKYLEVLRAHVITLVEICFQKNSHKIQ